MNILANLKRKRILKHITGNLGKVVEEEDKIICYIKQNAVNGLTKNLTLLNSTSNKFKEHAICKPIHYIFNNLTCTSNIYGYNNVNVYFNNCNFNYCDNIDIDGSCHIESSQFNSSIGFRIYANNLTIKSSDINPLGYKSFTISADQKLEIQNITTGENKPYRCLEKINIYSMDNTLVKDTTINCRNICINSPKLTLLNSSINAMNEANIHSNNISGLLIDAKTLLCNDILIDHNEKILINKKITPLSKNRDKLIETLKLIKNKCESLNNEEINSITTKIKNKPISKVLKK